MQITKHHIAIRRKSFDGTAPYRGAGRPEATYVIERLIDDAARELGFDCIELQTRNLILASKISPPIA